MLAEGLASIPLSTHVDRYSGPNIVFIVTECPFVMVIEALVIFTDMWATALKIYGTR